MGSQEVGHDWADFPLHFTSLTLHQSWPEWLQLPWVHLHSCSAFSAAYDTKVPCEEKAVLSANVKCLWWFERFRGWSRAKIYSWELVTQQVSLDRAWTGLHERSLWQHEPIQRCCMAWKLPPKGRRPREHPGEEKVAKGGYVSKWRHSGPQWEFLSQRVPRATALWSLKTTRLSYQWLADVGWVLQICKAYTL